MMKRFVLLLCSLMMLCSLFVSASAATDPRYLGSRAYGMRAVVVRDTIVRAAPTKESHFVQRLNPGDWYAQDLRIVGMSKGLTNGGYWYLVRWSDADYGWYGWVSANVVDVDQNDYEYLSGEGFCMVTVETCKARSGPGEEYGQVGMCVKGNGFMVREVCRGSNGKNWYNISVDGIDCWIAAGVAEYYPY